MKNITSEKTKTFISNRRFKLFNSRPMEEKEFEFVLKTVINSLKMRNGNFSFFIKKQRPVTTLLATFYVDFEIIISERKKSGAKHKNIIFEIDGPYHNNQREKDRIREEAIKHRKVVSFYRFSNDFVRSDLLYKKIEMILVEECKKWQ